jgi:hypothetical protein
MFNSRSRSLYPLAPMLGVIALVACDNQSEEPLPTPPDLGTLPQTYEAPTGTLATTEEVACVGQAARKRYDEDRLPIVRQVVAEALGSLRDRLAASGLATEPTPPDEDKARVSGTVYIQRICRGWDRAATTPNQQQDGSIELRALVNENGLQPVVWGGATNCRGRVDIGESSSVNLFLSASMVFYLYRGLRMGGDTSFLVKLTGEVGTEENRHSVDWDFRASTASIDLRLPTPSGDVIASVTEDGRVALQTRDGVKIYDPATMTCVAQSTTGTP